MAGCLALKGQVVHRCAVVCFIGDGAEYDVWNLVQISALRNRSALHLGAGTVEFPRSDGFHFFAGNKLVTADHASAEYLDFGLTSLADFLCHLCEVLVCQEAQNTICGISPRRVSEDAHIHVVLNSIGRNDDIADVNFDSAGEPAIPVLMTQSTP